MAKVEMTAACEKDLVSHVAEFQGIHDAASAAPLRGGYACVLPWPNPVAVEFQGLEGRLGRTGTVQLSPMNHTASETTASETTALCRICGQWHMMVRVAFANGSSHTAIQCPQKRGLVYVKNRPDLSLPVLQTRKQRMAALQPTLL